MNDESIEDDEDFFIQLYDAYSDPPVELLG